MTTLLDQSTDAARPPHPTVRRGAAWVPALALLALLASPAPAQELPATERELFVLPGAASEALPQFALYSLDERGNAAGRIRLPDGGFAFVLVNRERVIRVIETNQAILDDAGQTLGRAGFVPAAQFLSDGSVVVQVTVIDVPADLVPIIGSQPTVLLRADADGRLSYLPVSRRFASLVTSNFTEVTPASADQRFWISERYEDGDETGLLYSLTDGVARFAEQRIPNYPEEFDEAGLSTRFFRDVYEANVAGLLILDRTIRQFREAGSDPFSPPATRTTLRLGILQPGGAIRQIFDAEFERFPNFESRGTGFPYFQLMNARGDVVTTINSCPTRSSTGDDCTAEVLRIDTAGNRERLFDDVQVFPSQFVYAESILANGDVVGIAFPVGTAFDPSQQVALLGSPGRTRRLLAAGDTVEGVSVGGLNSGASFPRYAVAGGDALAVSFESIFNSGQMRLAMSPGGPVQEYTWTADPIGDWADEENWSPRGVPGLGDGALFNLDDRYEVIVGRRQVGRGRVEAGTVIFRETDLDVIGELRVGGGSTLDVLTGRLAPSELVIGHLPPATPEEGRNSTLRLEAGKLDVSGRVTIGDADEGFLLFENSTLDLGEVRVGVRAEGFLSLVGAPASGEEPAIFSLKVGGGAPGTFILSNGARLATSRVEIGGGAPGEVDIAAITIEGQSQSRSLWQMGPGSRLTIEENGDLAVGAGGVLEADVLQMGTLEPSGSAAPPATVAASGPLSADPAGELTVRLLELGVAAGARAALTATAGGIVNVADAFAFPTAQSGQLRMSVGANSLTSLRVLGEGEDGSPSVVSVLESPDPLALPPLEQCSVGIRGFALLQVLDGGAFECDGTLLAGGLGGGQGDLSVLGSGQAGVSTLRAGQICLGRAGSCVVEVPGGSGQMTLGNGGTVETGPLAVAAGSRIRGDGLITAVESLIEGVVEPGINFEVVPLTPLEPDEGGSGSNKPGRVAALGKSRLLAALESGEPVSRVLPGVLTFDGDVTFAAGATLLIDIEGPAPEEQDRLVVTGQLTIEEGARLVVTFGNGYAPRQGDVFTFLPQDERISGAFSEVEVAGLEPGFEYQVDTSGGGLRLIALNDGAPLGSGGGGGGGGGGEPPGDTTFTTESGQRVTCVAIACDSRRRADGGEDPGADLVVESLALAVTEAGAVSGADISVLVHEGEGDAPPAVQHFLVGRDAQGNELFELSALIELAGSETVIRRDESGLPQVVSEAISGTGLRYRLLARADGTALSEITDPDERRVAAIDNRIAGAAAVVDEDGALAMIVPVSVTLRAVVEVSAAGALRSRYERFEDGEWRLASRTLDAINDFAVGSAVQIESTANGVRLVIDSRVADALVF
jgi:hypothetical protein